MTGRLFGVGLGPGDPELLTLKAVQTIQDCPFIVVPKTCTETGLALKIAKPYLDGKTIHQVYFSMDPDLSVRQAARCQAAREITALLDQDNVAFLTLGDPTTYSTFMYVKHLVAEDGYPVSIVPGVTSYSAAAAALGVSLCEGNQPLTIVPAQVAGDLGDWLNQPGTKVIMKAGSQLETVLQRVLSDERHDVQVASCVSLADEKLYPKLSLDDDLSQPGYFSLVIVKENA